MTRAEFIKALSDLLEDIPKEEREEALKYYEGYFEDAGPEAEAEVIRELESPDKVAAMVKAGMSGTEGEFTERGYKEPGFDENPYEITNRCQTEQQSSREERAWNSQGSGNGPVPGAGSGPDKPVNKNNGWKTACLVLLAIITFPIWFSVAAVGFSVLLALVLAVGGVLFGIGLAVILLTGILLVCGLGFVGTGLGTMFSSPLLGFLFCSSGLLLTGLGVMALALTVLVLWKVIPVCVMGVINLCSWPFRKRRAAV